MNEIAAAAPAPETKSRGRRRVRVRRRNAIPVLLAIASLLLSHFLFGAGEPKSALFISGCLIISAVAAVTFAGPRHVTPAMLVIAAAIWIYGASGLGGRLDHAMPDLAGLFAAGAIWVIGFVAACQRIDIRVILAGLVWSSLIYCTWYFFTRVSGGSFLDGSSPAQDSIQFGLFALLGSSRVLHVVKQMDAEALSRSEMIERLLRDGLGGLLLTGFALTCLLMTGSQTGGLFAAAVLLIHGWWDMRAILTRDHRGGALRWLSAATPVLALGLAAWGASIAVLADGSAARDVDTGRLLHAERLVAYFNAWLEQPFLGHGLGSIEIVRDRIMNLWNADALLAVGGAQNGPLHLLVEVGIAGAAVLFIGLSVMHIRILAGMRESKAPRTMLRLALCASGLLALHGAFSSSLDIPGVIWLYALLLGAACGIAHVSATQKSGSRSA